VVHAQPGDDVKHILRPLDRYVLTEFAKIFAVTALGFPILLIVIDLTDHVQGYLERHLSTRDIALSYLFWIPDSMFMVMPKGLPVSLTPAGALPRSAILWSGPIRRTRRE